MLASCGAATNWLLVVGLLNEAPQKSQKSQKHKNSPLLGGFVPRRVLAMTSVHCAPLSTWGLLDLLGSQPELSAGRL